MLTQSADTPEAEAKAAAAPEALLGRTGPSPWVVAGVITLESLYILWVASRAFFFQDDFVDLPLVRQLGLDGRMLEQPIFGHFVPGYNLVNYFLASIVPYQWSFVVAAEVVLFALSLLLLHRLLTALFGSTYIGLALVALAGASFSLVPSVIWWASGLQQLVAIPAILAAVLCHVRYLSTGRVRFALCAGVAMTAALAFYDGALAAGLFIVMLTLLFWPVRRGLRGLFRTVVAYWPAWVCFAVPMGLDLAWRFSHYSLYATPPLPHAGQALQFVSLSWTQTFVPLLGGLDSWLLPLHVERVIAGVVGVVAIVAFVVWTIRRRRVAGRAWIMFGATFLFMESLVGLTRVSVLGPAGAQDSRYIAISVYFFMISVGFALLPLRAASRYSLRETAAPRQRHAAHGRRDTKWTVAIVAAVCVIVVAYGGVLVWDQDHLLAFRLDVGSRQFFGTFARSWPPPGVKHPFLWDTEINPLIMSASFYPYDTANFTIGKIEKQSVQFDAWGGNGYVVRSDGTVAPATPQVKAVGVVPPGGACVQPGPRPAAIVVPLNHSLPKGQWFSLVSYRSSTGATSIETGATVTFPKGSGVKLTAFAAFVPIDSVIWTVQAHDQLCITGVKIVVPQANEAG